MHSPKKRNWRLAKSRRNPAINFPRKTQLSTLTGRKKLEREAIHWEWSGARPPPGTTQWMCGCGVRVCPQVCRIERKPNSAPRCFGAAATSSSVPALASKSKENSCLLFCHINGTNSCGTLKTKWVVADVQQFLLAPYKP